MYPSEEARHSKEGCLRDLGVRLGNHLTDVSPPVPIDGGPATGINGKDLDDLTEAFQLVIAEALQGWLDAGSEREVTMEDDDLHLAIRNHLKSWSTEWSR